MLLDWDLPNPNQTKRKGLMKMFKKKINISAHELDYALAEYYKNHKGISLGKIKYQINKSAGLIYNIKAEILGSDKQMSKLKEAALLQRLKEHYHSDEYPEIVHSIEKMIEQRMLSKEWENAYVSYCSENQPRTDAFSYYELGDHLLKEVKHQTKGE